MVTTLLLTFMLILGADGRPAPPYYPELEVPQVKSPVHFVVTLEDVLGYRLYVPLTQVPIGTLYAN